MAPTVKELAKLPGAEATVLQPDPSFPAATTTRMPAARVASTASLSSAIAAGLHPSPAVHVHELPIASGALAGSGFSPFMSVGAMNHWKHSMYAAGEPKPWSMLRQPIQRACGATPIWLPSPSSPTMVPIVCVPCWSSSQGAGLS